ncbi:DUF2147 domain-containing protein [Sphingomonas sp.]|uniref:DUF2147 domain-containing protein n=1 Tax=Sphingomonas sp. TaxID=28214 RepID=UPI003B00CBD5
MLLLLGALFAATPSADSVVGKWKTETKNAVVQISKCGGSICGTLLTSDDIARNPGMTDSKNPNAALKSKPLKGSTMLSGFSRSGDTWDNGKVYKADEGKTYTGRITPIDANHIKLRGCVFVPLCKTQTWTRVN